MTQKHFIAIAAIIKNQRDENGASVASADIARSLADYFQTINPNFKRDLFLTACGFGG